MPVPAIKVVVIYSLAYSGTSWLNMVLGTKDGIVNLGAGDRLLVEGAGHPRDMCQVHGRSCDFWPSFFKKYNRSENFFVQAAEILGSDKFVLNNPSIALFDREFKDPRLDVRIIQQVRNGKACLASAIKHHPHRVKSVYQAALVWLYRGTLNLERRVANTERPVMLVRYEDVVENPAEELARIAEHTGIDYNPNSLRFWEGEHHLASVNAGSLDVLKHMQSDRGANSDRRMYYERLISRLAKTQGIPELDEQWRDMYSDVDLAAYDFAAGALYARFGYARDKISDASLAEFRQQYNPPESPEEATTAFPAWRLPDEIEGADAKTKKSRVPILQRVRDRVANWLSS